MRKLRLQEVGSVGAQAAGLTGILPVGDGLKGDLQDRGDLERQGEEAGCRSVRLGGGT